MPVRDASVESKRQLTSAMEVGLQLRKAVDARQLYAAGHPTTTQMIGGAHARLTAHLGTYGALDLGLTSLALTFQEKTVVAAERREESISHALFLEGVRTISFQPDLTLEELTALIDLWHTALGPPEEDGQTFATRFWEAGLKHVRIDTVETLVDGAAELAEIEAISDGLLAGHLPTRTAVAGALLDESAALAADHRSPPLSRASPVAITDAELRAFSTEVEAQRHAEAERVLAALTQLALSASPANRPRVEAAVSGIFTALARNRRFDDIARIAGHIAEARNAVANGPQATVLNWILQQIATPELVNKGLEAITSPELGDAAARALSYMPGLSAGSLIDALAGATDPAVRQRLVSVVTNLLPSGELLEKRLGDASPENATAMLQIASGLPPAERMRVQLRGLAHASAAVRRTVVESLKTDDVPSYALRIRPLLRDGDLAVRRATLNLLVRARDRETPALLAVRLADRTVEGPERKIIYQALGALGGEAASIALRKEFTERKEPELRAACALGLGRAGDELARPLLEAAGKKMFAPTELKEACRSALKRLDMLKSAAPGDTPPADGEA